MWPLKVKFVNVRNVAALFGWYWLTGTEKFWFDGCGGRGGCSSGGGSEGSGGCTSAGCIDGGSGGIGKCDARGNWSVAGCSERPRGGPGSAGSGGVIGVGEQRFKGADDEGETASPRSLKMFGGDGGSGGNVGDGIANTVASTGTLCVAGAL